MAEPVNRLMTPLPDSVLDRFFAEHPEGVDFRKQVETYDSVTLPRANC